ncbi:hypothetical protein RM549_13820 [Salegentibacter sp. F188]|uniref:Uncharacterized protein n=1 Tax=Autumnicola patrickiae TaxID=3075591 RepID=A0ABU3E4G8_9FLAO|nr:hypothetical protein [Salegentibacter sp. F188]MDT0690871.1 hypothetical protein [Salegentibacter sp. F188]
MKNSEIKKQIKTANENILRNVISERDDVFGNAKDGIAFKIDFGNENITNNRTVSIPIPGLEKAIEVIKEIDTESRDSEMKIRQIFNRHRSYSNSPLYMNCHFRRSDSY